MMRRVAVLLGLLALSLPLAPARAQEGGSLGVSPVSLEVPDARRGETYQRAISLQNGFDEPTTVTLAGLGDAGAWAAFDPGATLVLGPRANATAFVNLTVPADAENGAHEGFVQVSTEAKGSPDGSGYGVRHAASVALRLDVGGAEAARRVALLGVTAPDVERGGAARALLLVRNDGNVRATVVAHAQALDASTGAVAAGGEGRLVVVPGQAATMEVPLGAALPLGQYRVRAALDAPDGHAAETEMKVVERGTLGKSGVLRAILHEPRVAVGRPVELVARFENTGNATIAEARFTGTVLRDGEVVAVVESLPLVALPGRSVDLVAYHAPEEAGGHVVRGRVTYDGFQTPPVESLFEAQAATGARTPVPAGLVLLALGGAALLAGARRAHSKPPT